MALQTYWGWLAKQTTERVVASLEQMKRCERLGVLQRTTPSSDECKALQAEVGAYYKKYPE